MSSERDLIESYKEIAELLEAQGSFIEALEALEKCLVIIKVLVTTDPKSRYGRQELVACYKRIASLHKAMGNPALAVEALQTSVSIAEDLTQAPAIEEETLDGRPMDTPAGPADRKSFVEKFPKYWAFGSSGTFSCWRWSNSSQEDAKEAAEARAAEMEALYRKTGTFEQKYFYFDRPVREPLIEVVGESVVSRNAYGCLVLNSPNAMFVDIDFPSYQEPSFFKKMFAGTDPVDLEAHMLTHQRAAIDRIRAWTDAHPGWGWRAYRTFAGLRLLATHQVFAPDAQSTDSVFGELGADPLYGTLCRIQKCFRARLSPKPWRCGFKAPEIRWPWATKEDEAKFALWQAKYDLKSAMFSTCKLVGTIGNLQIAPALVPIVAYHDVAAGVESPHPLA